MMRFKHQRGKEIGAGEIRVSADAIERTIFNFVPSVSEHMIKRVNGICLDAIIKEWAPYARTYMERAIDGNTAVDERVGNRARTFLERIDGLIEQSGKYTGQNRKGASNHEYDTVLIEIGKINDGIRWVLGGAASQKKPLSGVKEDARDAAASMAIKEFEMMMERVSRLDVSSEKRDSAARILGKWFSGSRENHVKGDVEQYVVDYVSSNDALKVAFFLAVTKIGREASTANEPDLSELVLFGRIYAAGFRHVVLLDEFPFLRDMIRQGGSEDYKSRLRSMLDGRLNLHIEDFPRMDERKYEAYVSLLQSVLSKYGNDPHIPSEALERLAVDFKQSTGLDITAKEISGLVGDIKIKQKVADRYPNEVREEDIDELAVRISSFLKAKTTPGVEGYHDDALYFSITEKNGRLKIGYVSDVSPVHGVALIYPKRSTHHYPERHTSVSYDFSLDVVPESSLEKFKDELKKEFDIYVVKDEKGNFMAYALGDKGRKITHKDIYDAVDSAMERKSGDGHLCTGLLNVLLSKHSSEQVSEHGGHVSPDTLIAALAKIGISSESTEVISSIAFKLLERGVPGHIISEGIARTGVSLRSVHAHLSAKLENGTLNGLEPETAEAFIKHLAEKVSEVGEAIKVAARDRMMVEADQLMRE